MGVAMLSNGAQAFFNVLGPAAVSVISRDCRIRTALTLSTYLLRSRFRKFSVEFCQFLIYLAQSKKLFMLFWCFRLPTSSGTLADRLVKFLSQFGIVAFAVSDICPFKTFSP